MRKIYIDPIDANEDAVKRVMAQVAAICAANPTLIDKIISAAVRGVRRYCEEIEDHAQTAELAAAAAMSLVREKRVTPGMKNFADAKFRELAERRTYCRWDEFEKKEDGDATNATEMA